MSAGLRWTVEEYDAWKRGERGNVVQRDLMARAEAIMGDPFLLLLIQRGFGQCLPVKEFQPLPDRKFKLDYAWPDLKVGIEQQGYADHSTRKGLRRDYEKSNLCQIAGWIYLQFTPKQLADGSALPLVRAALALRSKGLNG